MIIKTALGFLIIIALVIGAIFFSNYFNEKAEAQSLTSQINTDMGAVEMIKTKTNQLKAEIAEISSNIDKTKDAVSREGNLMPPKRINSNEIVREILMLGQTKDLAVIPLSTADWTSTRTAVNDFQVFKMSLGISGEQSNVISFIQDLPTLYNSLIIESIGISKPDKSQILQENQPDAEAEITQINAKLSFAIYTR
jgi:hypothetical protein